jgi:hypothetical protein
MNLEELPGWLEKIGVPENVVEIGAEADNKWCVLQDDEGFEVFWREQGNRYDWARFTSEYVACHYLFGRLSWAQVARGELTLRTAPSEPAGAGDRST